MWSVLVLMLALPLSQGYATESGCEDWIPHTTSNTVCCNRCKPGNRRVTECGMDPVALCTVCENRTYVSDGFQELCHKCRECKGPMRVKKDCTASSDTLCECVKGYRCGDDQCSYCVQECGKGQQPSNNRGCVSCPTGTFNNKIHKPCISWSRGCPSPDQKIVAKGTAFSDIVCGPADDQEPTTPLPDSVLTKTPLDSKDDYQWTTLAIAIACAFLIICSSVPVILSFMYKYGQKVKTDLGAEEAPVAGWRQTPEPEQCSFCFPQEEHGSSSEVSLVSDDKPFELVV